MKRSLTGGTSFDPAEVEALLQELEIHRIELELQNEELRRAQQALQQERDRFGALYNNAPVGYVVLNSAGIVLQANAAMGRLAGRDCADLRGRPFADLLVDEDAAAFRARLRSLFRNPSGKQVEVRLRRRCSEGLLHAQLAASPHGPVPSAGDAAESGALLVTISDISERKQIEADRERLLAAIEQTSEAIVITDSRGAVQYVNAAFECITGYTRAEVLGRSLSLLKSGHHDGAFYRQLWETIAAGKDWKGRMVNRRKDGTLYTEEATISPIRDAAGTIVNYAAVKRDISRHLLETEERTKIETELTQARKMESIGRLAGGVAHDLNNLLTPIMGYGEMLFDDLADGPFAEQAEQVVQAAQRARDLVRQLLAFGRRQLMRREPLDLNTVLIRFERLLRSTIRENITILLQLDPAVPAIVGDAGQLEQVIMNLAVNAQDAMPDGGSLTIRTRSVDAAPEHASRSGASGGRMVVLSFQDTGAGIAPEALPHIFEPFFTTKETSTSTGLGLATVHGIVSQHGGTIHVSSELGKGTTFRIRLPVCTDPEPPQPAPATLNGSLGGSETVLLVEDNEQVRRYTQMILAQQGYAVLSAGTGNEAMDILRHHDGSVDLLLTDVIMPGMSGNELVAQACRERPGIKLLFISGYTADAIVHEGMLRTDLPFLRKPFTVRELAAKVREVLESG